MLQRFNQLSIAVPDLASARQDYTNLLGDFDGASIALSNIGIQLTQSAQLEKPAIVGLQFGDDALESHDHVVLENSLGLNLSSAAPNANPCSVPAATGILSVDHIVLRTSDADACIAQFGAQGMGLRLALDQQVPEWGGRMLFFRFAKMTLEVIHDQKNPPRQDYFWGITYLCPDLDFTLTQLDQRGVEHSEMRPGRKPGTRVATVHSHCLELPTLLIEPAPE